MNTKRNWIVIFWICKVLITAQAQSLEETYHLAKQAQKTGNFDLAIQLYQRILFFDEVEKYTSQVLLEAANTYFLKNDYSSAAIFYQRAAHYYDGDISTQIKLQNVFALLAANQNLSAKEELIFLSETIQAQDEWYLTYLFQRGVNAFNLQEYDTAQYYFKLLLDDPGHDIELEKLLQKARKIERKSEQMAFWLSVCIPGSGQLYAADYRNAANSFLLSAGLMALGVNTWINTGPIEAMLFVFPWWLRYHSGGAEAAKKSVQSFKEKRRYQIYEALIALMSSYPEYR